VLDCYQGRHCEAAMDSLLISLKMSREGSVSCVLGWTSTHEGM
jgi:hypothetical protein